MRRLPSRPALLVILGVLLLAGAPAGAQEPPPTTTETPASDGAADLPTDAERIAAGYVEIVQVSGLIDPIVAAFLRDTITAAERAGSRGVVLQLNSSGSVLGENDFVALARRIRDASVPVSIWVGPSGGAFGGAAELVAVASESGMAPRTRIGRIGEQRLPVEEFGVLFGGASDRLADEAIDELDALRLGVVTTFPVPDGDDRELVRAPVLGDFLVNLDGVESRLDTTGEQPRRVPVTVARFAKLSLLDQLLHTVSSPEVAFLLFAIGMALIIFELYTAGVGIAGIVGAGSFLLGCYGLAVLPTNWWGIALLVIAMYGFAVDTQTGVPYVWTWIGFAAFAAGTLTLYDGLTMSWVTVVAAWIGVGLSFTTGMPSMVRTRFSTPTIGREWMIGELGEAATDVDPNGTVLVRGAPWQARTNRATPIATGDPVRVVALDALVLEVEPTEGAARDYRERARSTE